MSTYRLLAIHGQPSALGRVNESEILHPTFPEANCDPAPEMPFPVVGATGN